MGATNMICWKCNKFQPKAAYCRYCGALAERRNDAFESRGSDSNGHNKDAGDQQAIMETNLPGYIIVPLGIGILVLGYFAGSYFVDTQDRARGLDEIAQMACRGKFTKYKGGHMYHAVSPDRSVDIGKFDEFHQAVETADLGYVLCVKKHDVVVKHCYYQAYEGGKPFDVPVEVPEVNASLVDLRQSKVIAEKRFRDTAKVDCSSQVTGKRGRYYDQTYGDIDREAILKWAFYSSP